MSRKALLSFIAVLGIVAFGISQTFAAPVTGLTFTAVSTGSVTAQWTTLGAGKAYTVVISSVYGSPETGVFSASFISSGTSLANQVTTNYFKPNVNIVPNTTYWLSVMDFSGIGIPTTDYMTISTATWANAPSIIFTSTASMLTSGERMNIQWNATENPGWANHVVISQFAVAGSASAADEFVELYNPTNQSVDISLWTLEYKSASSAFTSWGTFGTKVMIPNGITLAPGKFYLLTNVANYTAGNGVAAGDQEKGFNMSNSGNIRLLDSASNYVDGVGFGVNANASELLSVTTGSLSSSVIRKPGDVTGNGQDTNNNSDDFMILATRAARNNSSAAQVPSQYVYTKYEVWTSTGDNGSYTLLATVNGSGPVLHSGLTPNTTHFYKVRAMNHSIIPAYTSFVEFSTHTLSAVSKISLVSAASSTVQVSWPDNNPAGTQYTLEASLAQFSGYTTLYSGNYVANFTSATLTANTTYFYRYKTTNIDVNNSYNLDLGSYTFYSSVFSTVTLNAVPGDTTYSVVGSSFATITWADTNLPGTQYVVMAATGSNAGYEPLYTGVYVPSLTHNGLVLNTTYFYKVASINAVGAMNFNAVTSTHTLAVSPGAITLVNISTGSVVITFANTNAAAAGTKYVVEVATGDASYGPFYSGNYVSSINHAPLTLNTTYFYRVTAYNFDNTAAAAVTFTTHTLAAAPGAIVFVDKSTGSVVLNWADTNASAAGTKYILEESSGTNANYTAIYTGNYVASVNRPTLLVNVTYYYRVTAYNFDNVPAGPVLNSTHTYAVQPGAAALTNISTWTVQANWTPNGNSESTLYYSEGSTVSASGPFIVNSGSTTQTFYYFTNLTKLATYYFRVKAINLDNVQTNYTDLGSTLTAPGKPLSPTAFAGVSISTGNINWMWVDNAGDEDSYIVRTDTAGIVATLASNTTYWIEPNLLANTLYTRFVEANNATGTSSSTAISKYTFAKIPGASSFNTVGQSSITVSWVDSNPAGTVYGLFASTGINTSYGSVFSGTYQSSVTHIGLNANTTYYYKVRATNGDSISTDYNTENTTHTLAAAPNNLAYGTIAETSIQISWTSDSTTNPASTIYTAEISTSSDFTTKFVQAGTKGGNNATVTGLTRNTLYLGRVTATNLDGITVTSVLMAQTTTLATTPNGISASVFISSVVIGWAADASGNPAGTVYTVASATSTDFTTSATSVTVKSANSAAISNLTPNSTYYLRVGASNLGSVISYSAYLTSATLTVAPTVYSITGVFTSSITVSWASDVTGNAADTTYKVRSSTNTNFIPETSSVSALKSANSAIVAGLTFNKLYYIQLVAISRNGAEVSVSSSIYVSTSTLADLPAAYPVSTIAIARDVVYSSWTAGGNPAGTLYNIELSTIAQSAAAFVSYNVTSTSYMFTGLPMYATSYVQVRAQNSVGVWTPYISLGYAIYPNTVPPSAIASITVTPGTNDGGLALSWVATGDDGNTGRNVKYYVNYATFGANEAGLGGFTTNWLVHGSVATYAQTWVPVVAGSAESRSISDLWAGTTYYVGIFAQDAGGNVSLPTIGSGVSNDPTPIKIARGWDGSHFNDNTNGKPLSFGTTYQIRGLVTLINEAGVRIYVQDDSGAGILIYRGAGGLPTVNIGDHVLVRGNVDQDNGLVELILVNASDVSILSTGNTNIEPVTIQCKDLAASTAGNYYSDGGEVYESRVLKINNATYSGAWTRGDNSLVLSDITGSDSGGTRLYDKPPINSEVVSSTPTGKFDIIGVVRQFDGVAPYTTGYGLLPRSSKDIIDIVDDLSINIPVQGTAVLSWTDSKDADRVAYSIYRSATGLPGSYTLVTTTLPANTPGQTISYTNSGLNLSTNYSYYITLVQGGVFNVAQGTSSASNVVILTPNESQPTAITGLTAVPGSSEGQINLSWKAPYEDSPAAGGPAVLYFVKYATFSAGVWGPNTADLNVNTYSQSITPADPGNTESLTFTAPLTMSISSMCYFAIFSQDSASLYSNVSVISSAFTKAAPGQVLNLVATQGANKGTVDLAWTATGDDNAVGTAASYVVKYATWTFSAVAGGTTDYWWTQATTYSQIWTPNAAGQAESRTISNLPLAGGATIFTFAIEALDEYSNISPVSNVVSTTTLASDPGQITSLVATQGIYKGTVNLAWTATGASGAVGTASAYIVKYASFGVAGLSTPTTDYWWISASSYTQVWTPKASGQAESQTLSNLPITISTTFWFAIESYDSYSTTSPVSNVVSTTTLPSNNPSQIIDLAAATTSYAGGILLTWTAPGDEATPTTRAASSYVLKYTTYTMDATVFSGVANTTYVQGWTPAVPGAMEVKVVTGFTTGTTYYFGIKAVDEYSNSGALSVTISTFGAYAGPVSFISAIRGNDTSGLPSNSNRKFTIEGVVISTCQETGSYTYFINDNTGGISVNVYDMRTTAMNYVFGDKIRVTGTLSQNNGVTQLTSLTAHELLSQGNSQPTPLVVTCAAFPNSTTGNDGGEVYEGSVVKINGVTTTGSGNFASATYGISDLLATTTIYVYSKSSVVGKPIPTGKFDIVGIGGQYDTNTPRFDGYQIYMRRPADVIDVIDDLKVLQGNTAVTLQWTDSLDPDTTGYNIYWTTGTSAGYSGTMNISTQAATFVGGSAISRTIGGLNNNTTYWFYVTLLQGGTIQPAQGESSASNAVSMWPSATPVIDNNAPAAITTLAATQGTNAGEITLTWVAPYEDGTFGGSVASYVVKYATYGPITEAVFDSKSSVSQSLTPKTPGLIETLTIASLGHGVTYYFNIKSVDDLSNKSSTSTSVNTYSKPYTVITIAAARALADGASGVAIQGVITSLYDTSADFGNFMQDGTAGIDLYSTPEGMKTAVVGDEYLVIGNLTSYNGLKEITGVSGNYFFIGSGRTVTPVIVTCNELAVNGENYEGQLIKILNVTTSDSFPNSGSGKSMTITDNTGSVTLDADSTVNYGSYAGKKPDGIFNVIGNAGEFTTTATKKYQITPRGASDIEGDVTSPQPILSITVAKAKTGEGGVSISWPAPTDPADSLHADRKVAKYEIRYSVLKSSGLLSAASAWWDGATVLTRVTPSDAAGNAVGSTVAVSNITPQDMGGIEKFIAMSPDLEVGKGYYFGIKSYDTDLNVSTIAFVTPTAVNLVLNGIVMGNTDLGDRMTLFSSGGVVTHKYVVQYGDADEGVAPTLSAPAKWTLPFAPVSFVGYGSGRTGVSALGAESIGAQAVVVSTLGTTTANASGGLDAFTIPNASQYESIDTIATVQGFSYRMTRWNDISTPVVPDSAKIAVMQRAIGSSDQDKLTGSAGAVEPYSLVVIYSKDPSTLTTKADRDKYTVNKTTALADGSFTAVDIGFSQYPKIYVSAKDAAGNKSAASALDLPAVITETKFFQPGPNPFKLDAANKAVNGGKTTLWFDLVSNANVTIKIFNTAGEYITDKFVTNGVKVKYDSLAVIAGGNQKSVDTAGKFLSFQTTERGLTYSPQWDGTNDAGTDVASGVYIIYFKAGNYEITKKIVLIR